MRAIVVGIDERLGKIRECLTRNAQIVHSVRIGVHEVLFARG